MIVVPLGFSSLGRLICIPSLACLLDSSLHPDFWLCSVFVCIEYAASSAIIQAVSGEWLMVRATRNGQSTGISHPCWPHDQKLDVSLL